MSCSPIRLVLADPHPVTLEGLCTHLQACPDVQVQACVSEGDAAWQAVRSEEHTSELQSQR